MKDDVLCLCESRITFVFSLTIQPHVLLNRIDRHCLSLLLFHVEMQRLLLQRFELVPSRLCCQNIARQRPLSLRAYDPACYRIACQSIGSRQGQSKRYSHAHRDRRWWYLALVPLGVAPLIHLDANESPLASSTIPDAQQTPTSQDVTLDSESEEPPGIFGRIYLLLDRFLLEPLGTTRRFLYLVILFLPVLMTAPILALEFVGESTAPIDKSNKHRHEKRTTRWWYQFLVKQMERAGPTFIKV